jgi:hypothetical protein
MIVDKEGLLYKWKLLCHNYNAKQNSPYRKMKLPFIPSRRSIKRFMKALCSVVIAYNEWKKIQDELQDIYDRERFGYVVDDDEARICEEEDYNAELVFYQNVHACQRAIQKHKVGNGFLLAFQQESLLVAEPSLDILQLDILLVLLQHLTTYQLFLEECLSPVQNMDSRLVTKCILSFTPDIYAEAIAFVVKTITKERQKLSLPHA